MLTGLGGANLLPNFGVMPIAGSLTEGQTNALVHAVASNPLVQQRANALTQQLRQSGRIGADQQVLGVNSGRVFVASVAQVANAVRANTGASFVGQPSDVVSSLGNVNVRNMDIRALSSIEGLMNENQVNAVYKAFNTNAQARRASDLLTMDLLIDGRIRGSQRVVGILDDGRIVVTPAAP